MAFGGFRWLSVAFGCDLVHDAGAEAWISLFIQHLKAAEPGAWLSLQICGAHRLTFSKAGWVLDGQPPDAEGRRAAE